MSLTPALEKATNTMTQTIFQLCYIKDNWAYFTTAKADVQWGDDWNDAPYECNAGTPYEWHENDGARGIPKWEIRKVAFDGDLEPPCEFGLSLSVQQITMGAAPWLSTPRWCSQQVYIPAWSTYEDFCELVEKAGGNVYEARPRRGKD
jgi:hypothetical protein